jgi:2-phospho-L-lactate guanylyltransferase (CobY/MobA/RfbA family)
MKKIEILAICTHEGILQTINRLINNNELWNSNGAIDINEAKELADTKDFDLILIGSGLTAAEEQELESVLAAHKNIPVVKHYGGGSGLLFGEIYQALSGR